MCKRKFEREDDGDEKPSKTAKQDGAVDIDTPVEDKLKQLPPFPNPLPVRHPRFQHCTPPVDPKYLGNKSVYLAGSIEMGKAVQCRSRWQPLSKIYLSPCATLEGDTGTQMSLS
jgi:hypothetical protein